jgi:outer membrane protein TolC
VSNISTQGDQTNNEFVTAGILQQFNFGLKGQLSYFFSHTEIHNASTTFVPNSNFNDGIARLELSQSLWRNSGGNELKAQSTLIESQAKASRFIESFKIKSILANAESVYWSLSQMKKLVKVQNENLTRAERLVKWNLRRSNTGLGDRSDTLQAQSNFKLREYELKRTLQDQASVQRLFNSLRGLNNSEVNDTLATIEAKNLLAMNPPLKSELRDDVRAALEQQNLAKASATLAIERNKPTLELYGSHALNGRDRDRGEAIGNSFTNDQPTTAVGVRLSAPLDFSTSSSTISSYKKEQIAADLNYQRKVFDQDREWNDLLARFEDAKVKLKLVEQIAEAQKSKSTYENNRLTNGRTTTFQVLNFENDYANSESLRIQTETDLLNIYSQMKIFNAGGVQ